MKPTHILIALAALVYAAPVVEQPMALAIPGLDTHFQPHVKRCDRGPPQYEGKYPYRNQTYNQIDDGTPCRNVTMIYARGLKQKGNVGKVGDTGPMIFNHLAELIGPENLAIAGVTFKAKIRDWMAPKKSKGGLVMVELIKRAASQCPNTKIVLVGYSVGGKVLHKAAENLSWGMTQRITAAVTLGHKKKGSMGAELMGRIPATRTLVICKKGDAFCDRKLPWETIFGVPGLFFWLIKMVGKHTSYEENAATAAIFINSRLNGNFTDIYYWA
ncbi:cutinase [Fusarium agapanthi]|uniref:cutinase n=1 Tax=Fusarium agapanthi TaxID=1803897 RepID=A0A9P5EAY9_9HYPO|nr:cutinase [Fusarium agapanthi]